MSKNVVYWGKNGHVIERDEPIKYQVVKNSGEHVSYQVDLDNAKRLADKAEAKPPEPKKPTA